MNNPITVNCPQGTWTKIATGVKNICIWRSDKSPAAYLMTYRISGGAAPSSQLEGQPLFLDNYYERIQSAYAIDVYIFAVGDNGAIRVDEFLFYPKIDDESKSAIFIDYNHHEIHAGFHYFHSDVITLGNAAVGNYVLKVGAKDIHFVFGVFSDIAGFTMSTYEDVTSDDNGTLITPRNNNRNYADSSTGELRYNPTNIVITSAKILRNNRLGAGGNPSSRVAGSVTRSDEVILKSGLKYLLRITNLSTDTNYINVGMSWYENGI